MGESDRFARKSLGNEANVQTWPCSTKSSALMCFDVFKRYTSAT